MRELQEALAMACRILALEGHGDLIWGHVSVRDPSTPSHYWMKGADRGLDEVTAQDMILLDLDGRILHGVRKRHIEFPIHSEIYRRRPDVHAIVHTHPPYATILGSSAHPFRPVTHWGTYFWPPEIPRFDRTTGLIRTPELGEAVAETLGAHKAVFLKNHGIVVAEKNLERAIVAAVFLERACRDQVRALSLGAILPPPEEEALERQASVYTDHAVHAAWEYLCRQVKRVLVTGGDQ